jgi:hypothetical protein
VTKEQCDGILLITQFGRRAMEEWDLGKMFAIPQVLNDIFDGRRARGDTLRKKKRRSAKMIKNRFLGSGNENTRGFCRTLKICDLIRRK